MPDNTVIRTDKTTPLELAPEPIKPRSVSSQIARAVIAGIFILSMLYLFGGYQYLRFQETPASVNIDSYESVIDEPVQSIPTTVYVLAGEESNFETQRTEQLIENTNSILAQLAVELSMVSSEEILLTNVDLSGPQLVADPDRLREILPSLDGNRLYVVITRSLGGLNGIAFSGRDTVAVAEYTTGYDFRTLAHEVGHVLGLGHVRDKANLMYSGSSGTGVTISQAQNAYQAAKNFSTNE